ncbi:molybdate ABC transporter substrate-binding protein [Romboutsia weinsteinii]|uniref:Molybdate ABC transporter substrate-binding protein n=1 Tax=Romboutsia weinsteinii TaxID=2020949 RepID=A0A371J357_9FIRM|nr:molybdate ABC transporter substrate-binding protein [Romboutsia weinsteinii]RDY27165.1 molybdate ABC transporter substrate-binding protein [Romboutsia weinsteinii]
MQLRKIFKNLGIIIFIAMLAVGCSNPENSKKQSQVSKTESESVELNISAAASLKEAMAKLEEEYKKENKDIKLVVNFGASGSLQQQIEQGAPCDIFISAGKKQMDALNEGGLIEKGTYKNLVKNDLVLIAPKNSKITSINDLTSNKVKHIAVGEANSVPAGKYADEVLNNLNIKDSILDKLVFAKDVKEVLAWTQSGNAEAGFVYYSDAINTDKVKIVEVTSEESHSPITYPIAVIKDSNQVEEAKNFEEFLLSDKAQEILKECGYKSSK